MYLAAKLRIGDGVLGVPERLEDAGSVGHFEAAIEAGEEAAGRDEAGLGADLEVLDLARNAAELRGREDLDLDGIVGALHQLFGVFLREGVLRVVDRDHADAHGMLRSGWHHRDGGKRDDRRNSHTDFSCFLPDEGASAPLLAKYQPIRRTSHSVRPGQALMIANATRLTPMTGTKPR